MTRPANHEADKAIQEALDELDKHAKIWGKEDAAGAFMRAMIAALKVIGIDARIIREHLSKGGLEQIADAAADGARRATFRLGTAFDHRTDVLKVAMSVALVLLGMAVTYYVTWREAEHWDATVKVGLNVALNMKTEEAAEWLRLIRANPNIVEQRQDCEARSVTAAGGGRKACLLAVFLEADRPGVPERYSRR